MLQPPMNHLVFSGFDLSASRNGPRLPSAWCGETLWIVTVESVGGTPTTASLTAKFQICQPTTAAGIIEQNPIWADVSNAAQPEIVTQDFPTTLADQTLAAPAIATAVIKGGPMHRVVFTAAFTGGSSPKFVISAEAVQRA